MASPKRPPKRDFEVFCSKNRAKSALKWLQKSISTSKSVFAKIVLPLQLQRGFDLWVGVGSKHRSKINKQMHLELVFDWFLKDFVIDFGLVFHSLPSAFWGFKSDVSFRPGEGPGQGPTKNQANCRPITKPRASQGPGQKPVKARPARDRPRANQRPCQRRFTVMDFVQPCMSILEELWTWY